MMHAVDSSATYKLHFRPFNKSYDHKLYTHIISITNESCHCNADCSLQFRLKLVLEFFCSCGGVYFCSFISGLLS